MSPGPALVLRVEDPGLRPRPALTDLLCALPGAPESREVGETPPEEPGECSPRGLLPPRPGCLVHGSRTWLV